MAEQRTAMEMLGSITVDADASYDLGSEEKQWATIYIGEAVKVKAGKKVIFDAP